jgi:hypothetical protein
MSAPEPVAAVADTAAVLERGDRAALRRLLERAGFVRGVKEGDARFRGAVAEAGHLLRLVAGAGHAELIDEIVSTGPPLPELAAQRALFAAVLHGHEKAFGALLACGLADAA